jgi:hypothetical protein
MVEEDIEHALQGRPMLGESQSCHFLQDAWTGIRTRDEPEGGLWIPGGKRPCHKGAGIVPDDNSICFPKELQQPAHIGDQVGELILLDPCGLIRVVKSAEVWRHHMEVLR